MGKVAKFFKEMYTGFCAKEIRETYRALPPQVANQQR